MYDVICYKNRVRVMDILNSLSFNVKPRREQINERAKHGSKYTDSPTLAHIHNSTDDLFRIQAFDSHI